jgi:hypothetical protein
VMSVQGNSREVEVSKEEVWEDLENKAPSMGPGVVRIHLITLQCQTFTRDRYFKLGPIAGEMVEEEAEKSMLVEHPQPQVERHEVREGCLSGSKESLLIANKLFLCKKDFDKEPEQTRTLQIGCRNKQNEVSQFKVNDLTQDINEQENEVIPVK